LHIREIIQQIPKNAFLEAFLLLHLFGCAGQLLIFSPYKQLFVTSFVRLRRIFAKQVFAMLNYSSKVQLKVQLVTEE